MKTAEILSVGEELLCGAVVDTNAAYLSRRLGEWGYQVRHRQTCPDVLSEIVEAMRLAFSRADFVVATGGLGPTHDDLTRDAAAAFFGVSLLPDEAVANSLREYFSRRGVTMNENNLLQALVPEGAKVLWNDWGTAPGLLMEREGKRLVLLPGVPREMKPMFEQRVLPLLESGDLLCHESAVLHFFGIAESTLDALVSPLNTPDGRRSVAPYAGGGEVELRLTAREADEELAKKALSALKERVLSLAGEYCYGEGEVNLESVLVSRCKERKISLSTAESCTGGLLSQRITSVSGASGVFSLGLCTYSEKEKMERLGVKEVTLSECGVYSKECALEMARGVRALAGSDVGVGITGIAGPDGGTEKDPVGTVYVAAVFGKEERVIRAELGGGKADREYIRRLASSRALHLALSLIS